MPTLLLRFDPPMQSWGITLKLKDHSTERYPSKSGVVGLIASALGRRRDDDISDLAALNFGVRIDCQGTIISDFQVSRTEEKKNESYIGHREYLSDACFTCGIEASEDKLREIEEALLHPANSLYAGRRSCPVNMDLVQGIVDKNLIDALSDDTDGTHKTLIIDAENGQGDAVKDLPVSFSTKNRKYKYRFIEIR